MLAVLREFRGQGLGVRLKLAQRDATRALGLPYITWTFDPLQAANARLNLRRLGAIGVEFLDNLYGVTSSTLHHGLPTHRLLVRWDVGVAPGEREPEAAAGAVPALRVEGEGAAARSSSPDLELDVPRLLVAIPSDFGAMSRADPDAAARWHAHASAALAHYLGRGWLATDAIPGGPERPHPALLLERPATRA
jgi:predicted GNAT superfamily acetyltransferase